MRKQVLLGLLFTLGLSASVQAQALSLDQLIAYQKGGLSVMNNSLIGRGWVFKGKEEAEGAPAECDFPMITWLYGQSTNDASKADAFVFLGKQADCSYIVSYQVFNPLYVKQIRAAVAAYNMKLIDTQVVSNALNEPGVKELYQGATYTVEVVTASRKSSASALMNYYYIMVYKRS